MKYLTSQENMKEFKLRIKESIYNLLKNVSILEQKSLNKLLNEIIDDYILRYFSKISISEKDFFTETPNLVFNKHNLEIYQNDFIKVNLSQYKNKIDLVVTSPPYNLSIEYGKFDDSLHYEDYLKFTELWLKKVFILLKDDGRLCLNIPLDKSKNGQKPVYADVLNVAQSIGFKYKTTIVWNEGNISRRTAWGSWLSASAPNVIAPVEMIAVLYKHTWKKKTKGTSTITKDEFIEWTNGLWTFSGESKKRVKHPAPFPLELPRRCIKLFSYKEDIILDPFLGSGTTLLAALLEGRKAIGVEINPEYVKLSIERIKNTLPLPLKF